MLYTFQSSLLFTIPALLLILLGIAINGKTLYFSRSLFLLVFQQDRTYDLQYRASDISPMLKTAIY